VLAANPKTVVVLMTGTPVDARSWINRAPAVLQAWYPGQEGGHALAELLFGRASPSGKLPFSHVRRLKDLPTLRGYEDPGLKSTYHEGVFIGYRFLDERGIEPLFPFGHGLSYSTFEYGDLSVVQQGGGFAVGLELSNRGPVDAAEIAQVYVADLESSVDRPPRELKGFAKVQLAAGSSAHVTVPLARRAFAFYDETSGGWVVEPGDYEIQVGSSSRDLRLRQTIHVD
jgi:beta-glucosidase